MTDGVGMSTVTVMMLGSVVDKHAAKVQIGSYLRFENFAIVLETDYDYGDAKYILRTEHNSVVTQIEPFHVIANFMPTDKIRSLRIRKKATEKREKANYCTFTIAVAIIGILGQAEGFQMERYDIQVADGKTTNDIQMVSFWEATRTQYFELEKVFRQGRPVITMLKNVQGTFRNGLIRLTVQPYTIFAAIHDLTFQKLLLDVQEFHVAQAAAVGMEFYTCSHAYFYSDR